MGTPKAFNSQHRIIADRTRTIGNIVGSIALSFSFLSLMTWVAAWGIADILAWPAREAMKTWSQQGQIEDSAQWQRVTDKMLWAQRLNSSSADYAMDLGRLHEWQALDQLPWTTHAHTYRKKAIAYFKIATIQRPSWGFAWIHYAQSKTLNQEFGQEVINALEKAMVLAPWEVAVQRKVIWLGINLRRKLPEEIQQQLNRAIQRALILQPSSVINIAVELNWHAQLRPMLASEDDIDYLNQRLDDQRLDE